MESDMPQRVTAVHPHTEHEQKALQCILAKVCQLAHDVHGQMLCQPRLPQAAQDDAHPRQHPAAGAGGCIKWSNYKASCHYLGEYAEKLRNVFEDAATELDNFSLQIVE